MKIDLKITKMLYLAEKALKATSSKTKGKYVQNIKIK